MIFIKQFKTIFKDQDDGGTAFLFDKPLKESDDYNRKVICYKKMFSQKANFDEKNTDIVLISFCISETRRLQV